MPGALFFTDLEAGHFLSSIGLARRIQERGYDVNYISFADSERMVREQGFNFFAIMPEVLPLGSSSRYREKSAYNNEEVMAEIHNLFFRSLVTGKALDQVMNKLKPEFVCVLSLYPAEALVVHLRYQVPVVLLTPMIPMLPRATRYQDIIRVLMNITSGVDEFLDLLKTRGVTIRSLQDIIGLALEMPEMVLLPPTFDIGGLKNEPNLFFIGAGLPLSRKEDNCQEVIIKDERPLVYCSLGSQCWLKAEESKRFFQAVISAAAISPNLRFALSISNGLKLVDFPIKSSNIIVQNWLPQISMLSHSQVMLTHAGAGTLREAIASGVPMISYPLMSDQFCSAEAIAKHGIGVTSDIKNVTPQEINNLISLVLGNSQMFEKVRAMREVFRDTETLDDGIRVIERTISRNRLIEKV